MATSKHTLQVLGAGVLCREVLSDGEYQGRDGVSLRVRQQVGSCGNMALKAHQGQELMLRED